MERIPNEILFLIFINLERPAAFSLTCRVLHNTTKDPHARAAYFLQRYGCRLAVFYAIKNHAKVLNKETAEAMIAAGAIVSRNLVQRLIKDYLERQPSEYYKCCWTSKLTFGTYLAFLNRGHELYGDNLWAKDAMDDWEQFRICISLQSGMDFDYADQHKNTHDTNRDNIRELVDKYNVVPLPLQYGFGHISNTFVTIARIGDPQLLKMALSDLSNFDQYEFLNIIPKIIEKLIYNKPTPTHLKKALDNLFQYKFRVLEELALELVRNCGLYQVPNVILDTLIERRDSLPFNLDKVIIKAINDKFHSIYSYNGAPDNIGPLHHYFPQHRSNIQANLETILDDGHSVVCSRNDASYYGYGVGCIAVDFILNKFGPHHSVTQKCFDAILRDLCDKNIKLQKPGANNVEGVLMQGSPQFFKRYVEAGVRLRPEHLKMVFEKGMQRKWFIKDLGKALESTLKGDTTTVPLNTKARLSCDSKVAPLLNEESPRKQYRELLINSSSPLHKKNSWQIAIEDLLHCEREKNRGTTKQWSTRSRLYRMLDELHKQHFRT
ncbi:hypothetical protein G9A89_009655 [Geosiphon pyriformis]|nr:hypothetical protein G9A89_009655 [Geosiphon pyriformis]